MINKKIFVSGVLSLVLLLFLFNNLSFSDLQQVYSNLSVKIIFIGFFLYGLTYVFRSIRLNYLIKKNMSFLSSFRVVSMHNMLNQIFPFRSGEISLIYLLKTKGIDSSNSASMLILFRVLDFFAVILLLLFSLFFTSKTYELLFNNFLLLFLLSVLILLFGGLFLFKSRIFIEIIVKFISFLRLNKYGIFSKIVENLKKVSYNLYKHTKNKNLFFVIFVLSIFVWISSFIFTYYILISLGLELVFSYFVFAMALVLIFNSLPIHGLFNLGTQETFWTIAFVLIGVEKSLAISSGFIIHILVIFYFLIFGLLSFVYDK
tara:strand:+ start:1574 stop:2524 length:951 start_codon:yes stop_codon:yes gene_type:complete